MGAGVIVNKWLRFYIAVITAIYRTGHPWGEAQTPIQILQKRDTGVPPTAGRIRAPRALHIRFVGLGARHAHGHWVSEAAALGCASRLLDDSGAGLADVCACAPSQRLGEVAGRPICANRHYQRLCVWRRK